MGGSALIHLQPARFRERAQLQPAMRLPYLLLGCALLASSLFAGDIRLVGVGQVMIVNPDPLTGPLAGIVVGSPFEMTVEVFDTPTPLGAGAQTYPYDDSVGGVDVGPLSFTYNAPIDEMVIIDSPFAGDQISTPITLEGPVDLSAGMAMTDVTGAALTSLDLALLIGTTFDLTQANLVGGLDMGSGAQTVVVNLTQLRIEAGSGSGGPGSGAYCVAAMNSTGGVGAISTSGSFVAANNDLTLNVSGLPTNAFGFFITSQTQVFVMGPGGSQGNLCVGGSVGRYVGPGQIQNSGSSGAFSLALDLTQTPTPNGFVSVVSGETWNFQAWFRDVVGGTSTSNFTNGFSVVFQ